MKRSLVTGGHGFVASHLIRALLERGDTVTVIDRAEPELSGLTLQGIANEVELFRFNLADLERTDAVVGAGEFDAIFHLAAQTIVGTAMADPIGTFSDNVEATWKLLEACRSADVPAVVIASSDKAYGASDQLPYREDQRLAPGSPYEASKAAADLIALSYWRSFGLPVAVTRFANIYGGGDLNFSRLIPETVTALLSGRRPLIRSDGSPERDLLYVNDAVAAYLAIESAVGARGPAAGEALNAGGERPCSVSEIIDRIVEISGTGIEPEYQGTGNPSGEIDRQYVDSAKLKELTGWHPEVELSVGLRRTVDWYTEHTEARPVG